MKTLTSLMKWVLLKCILKIVLSIFLYSLWWWFPTDHVRAWGGKVGNTALMMLERQWSVPSMKALFWRCYGSVNNYVNPEPHRANIIYQLSALDLHWNHNEWDIPSWAANLTGFQGSQTLVQKCLISVIPSESLILRNSMLYINYWFYKHSAVHLPMHEWFSDISLACSVFYFIFRSAHDW